MKRLISLLLFATTVMIASAFDLAEECDNIKGVSTVSINQSMLKLVSFPDKGTNPVDLEALSSRLDKVQIINADEPVPSAAVKNAVNRYLSGAPRFERTMKMKDGDESVMMYMRTLSVPRSNEPQNEFLIIVEDAPDITVVLLVGKITMDELANVTDL